MTTKVKVTNISSKATSDAVAKFFSFCGKITDLSLTRTPDGKVEAILEFDTADAAKTALLLTHAWIEDQPITVEPFTGSLPEATPQRTEEGAAAAAEAAEGGAGGAAASMSEPSVVRLDGDEVPNKQFAVPDSERTSTSVIASLLAGGYTLGVGAADAAKELDERNRITQTMSDTMQIARENIQRLDEQYGISQRASAVGEQIGGAWSHFDEQYHVRERTAMAAGAVADGASAVGQSISSAATSVSESAMANPTFANTYNSITTSLGNFAGAVAGAVAPPLKTASQAIEREVDDIKVQTQEKIDAQRRAKEGAQADATLHDSDSVTQAFNETDATGDAADAEGEAAAPAAADSPAQPAAAADAAAGGEAPPS